MNEQEIYRLLADHQQVETWEHRGELVQELQRWAEIFDLESKNSLTLADSMSSWFPPGLPRWDHTWQLQAFLSLFILIFPPSQGAER